MDAASDPSLHRGPRLAPGTRFDPMSGSWPMILVNVVWVVSLMVACELIARNVSTGWSELAVFGATASVALLVFTAVPLRYFLMRQRRVATAREELLSEQSERRAFESQLVRALEMTSDHTGALDVAVRALAIAAPSADAQIMLADSSRAHLATVAASPGDGTIRRGCTVETPRDCPAVRSGHAVRFDDVGALDVCPHLHARTGTHEAAHSALCVPVSVMGSATGVVHLVHRDRQQFDQRDATAVAHVAQQLGSRLGLVTAMAQSELQASTDPLTGLLNRRSLENEVRALVTARTPFAVVLADLDHFKVLNDTHGHDAGDRALRVFARVLRSVVRDRDLVCRYGGEEFVVVMPNSNAEHAAGVVERLRLELMASFGDGRTPPFTVSAGAIDTGSGDDLAELISQADRALLHAKATGRNRTVMAPDLGMSIV